MADTTGSPPAGGDATRAPTLIGVSGALISISIICAAARLYTRLHLVRMPGVDDAIIIFCIMLNVMNFAALIKATSFGLGRHAYYLTEENYFLSSKWDSIAQPFGIVGVALPKLAVLIFLARIVGAGKNYGIRALYVSVITLVVFSGVLAIVNFAQCSPPSAAWTADIPHSCWNPAIVEKLSFFFGAFGAFNDLALAIYPITVISRLEMSQKRKVGICFLMGLGVLACACAVVRTTKLAILGSDVDWTWKSIDIFIWATAEINVIVICACVPTLLPLVSQVLGHKDHLSRREAGADEQSKYATFGSKRSLWGSIMMRPINSQRTGDLAAFPDEGRERTLPEGEIRTTTELQTQWEAV